LRLHCYRLERGGQHFCCGLRAAPAGVGEQRVHLLHQREQGLGALYFSTSCGCVLCWVEAYNAGCTRLPPQLLCGILLLALAVSAAPPVLGMLHSPLVYWMALCLPPVSGAALSRASSPQARPIFLPPFSRCMQDPVACSASARPSINQVHPCAPPCRPAACMQDPVACNTSIRVSTDSRFPGAAYKACDPAAEGTKPPGIGRVLARNSRISQFYTILRKANLTRVPAENITGGPAADNVARTRFDFAEVGAGRECARSLSGVVSLPAKAAVV
jgi:hypothetical protein